MLAGGGTIRDGASLVGLPFVTGDQHEPSAQQVTPSALDDFVPPSLLWFGVALLATLERPVRLPRGAFDVDALAALRDALMALGYEWRTVDGGVALSGPRPTRGPVRLTMPAADLSALVLLAATRGRAPVEVQGLAATTEVEELAELLNQMGADVVGVGTPVARAGGHASTPVLARPGRDRGEALFLLVASALLGSFVVVDVPAHRLAAELLRLQRAGITVKAEGPGLVASGRPMPFDLAVADDPRPWLVLALCASGASVLSGPRLRDAGVGELITTLVRLGTDLLPRADLLYVGGGADRAPTTACGPVTVTTAENGIALLLLGLAGMLPQLVLEIDHDARLDSTARSARLAGPAGSGGTAGRNGQVAVALQRVAAALGLPADIG